MDEVAALQARLEELTTQLESMEMDIKKFTTNTSRVMPHSQIVPQNLMPI